MVMKKTVATVKYRFYGKHDHEKTFETYKEAKGFFYGFVVKRPNVTGELIAANEIVWG